MYNVRDYGAVGDVEVANASAEPLPGMHGLYLEQVSGVQIEGLRCYSLQPGFETVVRR